MLYSYVLRNNASIGAAKKRWDNLRAAMKLQVKNEQNTGKKTSTEDKLLGIADEVTERNFLFNHNEAQTSRDWEEMMSNTSHQREVADLKAAGLNPVLSANSGAMAYTGATASSSASDPVSALASIYDRKLANKNNLSVTQLNNKNAKDIAELNYKSTKYAANAGITQASLSAAATRAAAGANAAATRAAAAQNAAATIAASQNSLEAAKYTADNNRSGSWAGLLGSAASKYGQTDNGKTYKSIFGMFGSNGSNSNIKNRVR